MASYTRDELFSFLEYASSRGLMKSRTASSYRSACSNVLEILDEKEASDLSSIDLDSIFSRYQNLRSMQSKPETMLTYQRRVKYIISEFVAYQDNPARWKSSTQQRTPKKNSSLETSDDKREILKPDGADSYPGPIEDAAEIVHKFPLRQGTQVKVLGVPFDVTKTEMARFTAWLSNLVVPEEEPRQLMLGAPPELQE